MTSRRTGRLAVLVLAGAVGFAGCLGGTTPKSPSSGPTTNSPSPTAPTPSTSPTAVDTPSAPSGDRASITVHSAPTTGRDWVVLVRDPKQTEAIGARLKAAGLPLTSTNSAVGMVTLRTTEDVNAATAGWPGVLAAVDRSVGWAPDRPSVPDLPPPAERRPATSQTTPPDPPAGGDPFDGWLWGHEAVRTEAAWEVTRGRRDVRVGIIDTGVDATHPDLVGVLDVARSRNFVTDIPDLDGPCEHASCVDPPTEDGGGHGTHVAGIVAAAANGFGTTGVAPGVTVTNLRAGQDSGYFFTGPSVNAITQAADDRLDVVNMSFYVDPWLYLCEGGAPGDTPAQVQAQTITIELMQRALEDAHARGVTLVAAAGNSGHDLADPQLDDESPNYGAPARDRVIDKTRCRDLPVEDPHVIGVSAIGPRGELASYSNWTTDPDSGEIEVAAPGGNRIFGPARSSILSLAPRTVLLAEGLIDDQGRVTLAGAQEDLLRACPSGIAVGAPDPDRRCGFYAWAQGTSMAAPHAAGVAALLISAAGKRLPPEQVGRLLATSARDVACPAPRSTTEAGAADARCVGTTERNGWFGEGVVDAAAAVKAAAAG